MENHTLVDSGAGHPGFGPSVAPAEAFSAPRYDFGLADRGDILGILAVQEPNLPENGGGLTVRMSPERIGAMMDMMPVIVARENDVVVGYLFSSPLALFADVPVIQAMVAVYAGTPGAYIYGPICVAQDHRKNGVGDAMYNALRAHLPDQEGFTFVRKNNATSMAAHQRMGLNEVGVFQFNGAEHAIFSYMG